MQAHYFLSQFEIDAALNIEKPICLAYGGKYLCPTHPFQEGGWALVQMLSTPMQMEAAKQDPRVLVLPYLFSPEAVDDLVISTYSSMGAVAGMSFAHLLATLAQSEPLFAKQL